MVRLLAFAPLLAAAEKHPIRQTPVDRINAGGHSWHAAADTTSTPSTTTATIYPHPVPTIRQMEWMTGKDPAVGGFSQFMHFGLPTFWAEGDKFLPNGTYHDCKTTAEFCDELSCGSYAPCLSPELFQPTDLDVEQWVLAAKQLGVQEICLTAQHEGGFTLWPSNYTNYSVAASSWLGGRGDVLQHFADACNKHDMGICYYLHPSCDFYSSTVEQVSAEDFTERQLGKFREVIANYGPVNRFWFDNKNKGHPDGLDLKDHVGKVIELIRAESPGTLISGYREFGGDIASSYESLYLFSKGPEPNTTSVEVVGKPSENGGRFYPLEQVGICMQEGKSGNEDSSPTFWFEHPLIGHANNSRIFDSWLHLVGHGEVGMINISPGRSGQLRPAYVDLMAEVGKAIRDTFTVPLAAVGNASATCGLPIELDVQGVGAFDFIEIKEDLTKSQRIRQYIVECQPQGSDTWSTLVSPVKPKALGDRPAGGDQRDAHVGFRRIDVPEVVTDGMSKIRFRALKCIGDTIYLASLAVYKKRLPWEQSTLGSISV